VADLRKSAALIMQFIGYALVFLTVLAVSAYLLHPVLRGSVTYDLGMLDAKLAHYDAHKDEYDVLFIGSSLTLRQVDTPALEAAMAKKSCKIKPYNLGIAAAKLEEIDYMLDHVLAQKPDRLRLIVLSRPFSAPVKFGGVSDRARYFSDTEGTAQRFANIANDVYQGPKQWVRYGVAAGFFGYEHLNIGLLSRIAFPDAFAASATDTEVTPTNQWAIVDNGGFLSLDRELREDKDLQKRIDDFGYKAADFEQMLKKGQLPLKESDKTMPEIQRRGVLLADLALKAEAQGIDAGILLFPTPSAGFKNEYNIAQGFKDKAPDSPVFSAADPAQYPQFWSSDVWFDQGHMNEKGANELTAVLADQMADYLCGTTNGKGK
jgi:hypothetical protein